MSVDLFGKPIQSVKIGKLDRQFLMSPFSVLNASKGPWKRRKRQWLRLGIQGDAGRILDNANGTRTDTNGTPDFYARKRKLEKKLRKKLTKDEAAEIMREQGILNDPRKDAKKIKRAIGDADQSASKNIRGCQPKSAGTSIFDPVLCELMYRWFCPSGGRILDPFCGGATAGIVAATLGYKFTGIDTRKEQIAANRPQAKRLNLKVNWICGDSEQIDNLVPSHRKFDFLWTDPPYFDLEVYGGEKNDGSMIRTFEDFLAWYRPILRACVKRVRNNRFVGMKIGEIRDKKGVYHNFVGHTIGLMQSLGLHYYNEIVLLTPAGSLPIRAGKQFQATRKIGKTHQNVLIFWKGDPKKIGSVFSKMQIRND